MLKTALTLLVCLCALARGAEPVKSFTEDWQDKHRERTVPVRFYLPSDLPKEKPAPVVIFSHGLGGSRDYYQYWGQNLARHGYVSLHLQHVGSDDSLWRGGAIRERAQSLVKAANAQNYLLRVGDVKFALDQLAAIAKSEDHALSGKIDLDRIAMAGHSFGAVTTQALAGQIAEVLGREVSAADDRIKCAVILSPSQPRDRTPPEVAFGKIKIPCFYLTGTDDQDPISRLDPVTRQVPYRAGKGIDQYLLVLKDADHMVFAGRGSMTRFLPLIEKSTVSFLDAYLKGDAKQKQWLRGDFKNELNDRGTFEWR